MSIDSTWLRCPNCFHDLSPVDPEERTFGCDAGHRFDRAKHGYLTLLPPKAPKTIGDDPAMLRARSELLGSGAYAPIAEALVAAVRATVAARAPLDSDSAAGHAPLRVADLGCGTGHYSARIAAVIPKTKLLLADRSPDAVRASLRALPDATGVVLDIWRPLPLRDDAADIILNVFAPRNLGEFDRVLRADGVLLIVVPTDRHLGELRRDGLVLEIPGGKAERLTEQLTEDGFGLRSSTSIEYVLEADTATRFLLAEMGPAAHHLEGRNTDGEPSGVPLERSSPEPVTISVELLAFSRTGPGSDTVRTVEP